MIAVHPKTQALIFDCDGTIADAMEIHHHAWQCALKKHGITHISLETLNAFNGLPSKEILRQLLPMHSSREIETIVQDKEHLAASQLSQVKPIQPVVDVIQHYDQLLPMVVISGGKRESVMLTLACLQLLEYFSFIITADDEHPLKNTPEAFRLIAKRLNVDCEWCQVFEDGKPGLINAIQAGMRVTDVRTFYP